MSDAFLLGAGYSKAICKTMPTMRELYDLMEPLIGVADGFTQAAYDYADGNVETLLSYYAIPNPHDDPVERARKERVTILLEMGIGELLQKREQDGVKVGLNPNGSKLASQWHANCSHVLTTNYDTIIERIAAEAKYKTETGVDKSLSYTDLYPIPVSPAVARDGGMFFGSEHPATFTLYKLHGSTSWYKSQSQASFDPIYGLTPDQQDNPRFKKFIADKRRFIIPPVYDKSSLLDHESIRSLWWQAKTQALQQADKLYVIGYSLPETDAAMQTLLWEGTGRSDGIPGEKKPLYIIDMNPAVIDRYSAKLGKYYDIMDCYVGNETTFDVFVEDYVTKPKPR